MFSRLQVPLLVLFTVLACVAVHEAGHVLVGWSTGARVIEVEILSPRPHVRLSGAATATTTCLRAVGGSGLVLALWLVALTALPRQRLASVVFETLSFFAGIELLGWLLSALLHRLQPQANDAGRFLAVSGLEPWAVAAAIVLLSVAGYVLSAARRGTWSTTPVPAGLRSVAASS